MKNINFDEYLRKRYIFMNRKFDKGCCVKRDGIAGDKF